ncbi:fimbria/pilus outer membrane usher protein [Hafnia paralvei]|uniref:fimbria/pilus outer membrane usher protein n=1 Tax=Hafnia paralvei TaxID=546367 RepID=UPI0026DB9E0F|nr:fimbria/pilus outer membrane usher protein [Hafnia paralvei]MDX6910587.1 fimbria/pilus outer membrane usher protein [Hafnia paralvei]
MRDYRHKPLWYVFTIMAFFCPASSSYAEDAFDTSLLSINDGSPKISNIPDAISGNVAEGTYHVHLVINKELFSTENMLFKFDKNKKLQPCISISDYEKMNLKDIPSENKTEGECVIFSDVIKDGSADFDFPHMTVNLSIPQVYIQPLLPDEIPPALWDEGIPAAILEYQFSSADTIKSVSKDQQGFENFLAVKDGINIGSWRYRNSTTYSSTTDGEKKWNSIDNYIETDIKKLKSELVLGDAYTAGTIFDSNKIMGIQLSSDNDMLPDSINGYAPTVHGIAKSNATVTIRDHGNIIYQENVAPGPFQINDLSPVSTAGTMDVTITEVDGSERHFIQNYATVPNLLRQGQIKYSITTGRISADVNQPIEDVDAPDTDSQLTDQPVGSGEANILQATFAYGLPWNLTASTGIQRSTNDFIASNIGLGINLGLMGAISVDETQDHNNDRINSSKGNSLRLSYSNHLDSTDSDIQFSYRNFSNSYLTLADSLSHASGDSKISQQTTFSLNQMLYQESNLFTSFSRTEYNDHHNEENWQTGFSLPVAHTSVSLSFGLSKSSEENADIDRQVTFNISIPLGDTYFSTPQNMSLMMNNNLKDQGSELLGLNGQIMDNKNMHYSMQLGYDQSQSGSGGSNAHGSVDYKTKDMQLSSGVNKTSQQEQITFSGKGGAIIHRYGITFGQSSAGAMALISVPGANNISLNNGTNLATDWQGYAIVPDLSLYKKDEIQFDADSIGNSVTLNSLSTTVIPTRDAIVLASIETQGGRKVLILLDGDKIAFGAEVTTSESKEIFYVDDQNQVFLTTNSKEGDLVINDVNGLQCKAHYSLPPQSTNSSVTSITIPCIK